MIRIVHDSLNATQLLYFLVAFEKSDILEQIVFLRMPLKAYSRSKLKLFFQAKSCSFEVQVRQVYGDRGFFF